MHSRGGIRENIITEQDCLPVLYSNNCYSVIAEKGKLNLIAQKDFTEVYRCINRPKSTKQTLGENSRNRTFRYIFGDYYQRPISYKDTKTNVVFTGV
jgi:hypothetical protein